MCVFSSGSSSTTTVEDVEPYKASKEVSAVADTAVTAQKERAAAALGQKSTILTGALGEEDAASGTEKKKLLSGAS